MKERKKEKKNFTGADRPAKTNLKNTFRNIGIGSHNYCAGLPQFTHTRRFDPILSIPVVTLGNPTSPKPEPLQVHAGHRWLPVRASSSRWMSKDTSEISQNSSRGVGRQRQQALRGNPPLLFIYLFIALLFPIVYSP